MLNEKELGDQLTELAVLPQPYTINYLCMDIGHHLTIISTINNKGLLRASNCSTHHLSSLVFNDLVLGSPRISEVGFAPDFSSSASCFDLLGDIVLQIQSPFLSLSILSHLSLLSHLGDEGHGGYAEW